MGAVAGKNAIVSIDSVDYSAFSREAKLARTDDELDTSAFGATGHTYIAGLTNGQFTVSGHFDDAGTNTPSELVPALSGAVTILWQPEGAGTGKTQRSFSGLRTGYDEEAASDGLVEWAATFRVTGAITDTDQV